MKTIEFFGPPGVGKSYIVKEIMDYSSMLYSDFFVDRDILSRYSNNNLRRDLMSSLRWLTYRLLGHPQRHLISELSKDFVLNNQEFADFIFNLLEHRSSDIYHVDSRLILSSYFMHSFEKVTAISEFNSGKYCLLDEGLLQRIVSLYSDKFNSDAIDKYIFLAYNNKKYKPRGAIHCTSSIENIMKNIDGRNSVAGSHYNMTKSELIKYTELVNIFSYDISKSLKKYGIPVLTIDTNDDSRNIYLNVKRFVKEI